MDTGEFEVEDFKTIMVGPNEAGKSAILQALQQLNPPEGVKKFSALRDYPRSKYNDITTGRVDPSQTRVVTAEFSLEDADKPLLSEDLHSATYSIAINLDNSFENWLNNAPDRPTYLKLEKDFIRLADHADKNFPPAKEGEERKETPTESLARIVAGIDKSKIVMGESAKALSDWLTATTPHVDESNETEEARLDKLRYEILIADRRNEALKLLKAKIPVFVLFNNYFRVRPNIHLANLAARIASGILDDAQYDYGNQCLLKFLGFEAQELSNLGRATEPGKGDVKAMETYRDQLDDRQYKLNAANVKLTKEIRQAWNPNESRGDASRLNIKADGQYLKVVVEDDLGVEVELDQRSEGFQWLVSFFVVFFAEAQDKHENAILLLDEPGLSLHALKQRDFRKTISILAEKNQTLYTTHSPFLVGPDELDLVRVVEMPNRSQGTIVHTTITATDPAALLPLQEALGYDLAQSLFTQQRNLVLEGLTDFWYLEAAAALLRAAGVVDLDEKIALIPANSAGKVVYYATILHAQGFKVAALLDSDAAGDQAAEQEVLVHTLGNKRILRTKDHESSGIKNCEIEDLLRSTLIQIANDSFSIDVASVAASQPQRPIIDIFAEADPNFSKYKLAKAFVRWSRDHEASDLPAAEQENLKSLISAIGKSLK